MSRFEFESVYQELDPDLIDKLREEGESLSERYFDRLSNALEDGEFSKWILPEKVDLMHLEKKAHHLQNDQRFRDIFDLGPVIEKTLDLQSKEILKGDAECFGAVKVISDAAYKAVHKELITDVDTIIGDLRGMSPEERLKSEGLVMLEKLSSSKILEVSASLANLNSKDLQGLELKNLDREARRDLITGSRVWEECVSRDLSMISNMYQASRVEMMLGRKPNVSRELLLEAANSRVLDNAYERVVRENDYALELDPYENIAESQKEVLISDKGIVQTDLVFAHGDKSRSYDGQHFLSMSGDEKLDLLSTAISEYAERGFTMSLEEGEASKATLKDIAGDSFKMADDLCLIYSEKFRLPELRSDEFRDRLKSQSMIKAAVNVGRRLDRDLATGEASFISKRVELEAHKIFLGEANLSRDAFEKVNGHYALSEKRKDITKTKMIIHQDQKVTR